MFNSCSEREACTASPQPGPLIIYDVGQTLRRSWGDMQRMQEAPRCTKQPNVANAVLWCWNLLRQQGPADISLDFLNAVYGSRRTSSTSARFSRHWKTVWWLGVCLRQRHSQDTGCTSIPRSTSANAWSSFCGRPQPHHPRGRSVGDGLVKRRN